MEEQKKDETLSKLYTLRAGLSKISQEKDIADSIVKKHVSKLQDARREISDTEDKIREIDRLIEESKSEIASQDSVIRYIQDQLPSVKASIKKDIRAIVLFVVCMSLLLLFAIIEAVCLGYLFSNSEQRLPAWFLDGGMAVSPIGLIAMIVLLSCKGGFDIVDVHLKSKKETLENLKSGKAIKGALEKQKDEKLVLCDLRDGDCFNKSRIDIAKDEHKQAQEKYRSLKMEAENDKEIEKHIRVAEALYQALQEEYSPMLDSRDWRNIDLIIFSLETRRADNLKEALAIVDQENRTGRIVSAIGSASAQICGTLRDGMARLGKLITVCANELSERLDQVALGIDMQSKRISETMEKKLNGIGEYVLGIANEISLGNALQAKANETSLKLMADVKEMREHSDYADWRLRNY